MTKYTVASERTVEISEKEVRVSTTHRENFSRQSPVAQAGGLPKSSQSQRFPQESPTDTTASDAGVVPRQSLNAVNTPQNFMVIPPNSADMQNVFAKKSTSRKTVNEKSSQPPEKSPALKSSHQKEIAQSPVDTDMKSVRSASSVESFKSARSIQEEDMETARKIKAVQRVMHAFRSALDVLNSLVEKRIEDKRWDLYTLATHLKGCLVDGREHIDRRHIGHFKQHGKSYVSSFGGNCKLRRYAFGNLKC